LVAIAVERSLEMIVGILGILKAGGAYVPLDPSYPTTRLQFMLEDTKAPIIITDIKTIDKIPSTWAQVICLNDEWENIGTLPSANPESVVSPHNLAYVIYTSGSTGKPKGVMVNHQGVSNLSKTQSEIFEISAYTRMLQFSSYGFDASVSEIFTTILKGGSLFLLDKETILNNDLFVNFFDKNAIDLATFPPSFLQNLSHDQLPSLKTLILAGESSLSHVIELWSKDRRLVNAYGPTEGTICSSTFLYQKGYSTSVIGRPISNTQIYILDEQLNPVPIGVSGEIYIGGVGLARGYLNRPDLTAERFIPNPFVDDINIHQGLDPRDYSLSPESLRLYRTGDLARYLPDGNIEFLGRIDDQVKIRGFRIELGEIESVLQSHGDISRAVVVASAEESKKEPTHKKLVAYVVPGEFTPSSTELREFLLEKFPDYMVPSFFIYIDKVPLTPNGKIDRKALPAPNLALRLVADEYVAPQTSLEQELCEVWKDVLKLEKIGIHDNFFRLGGDSIISIQMVSKARSRGIHFAVKNVFNYPTIKALASVAKTQENDISLKPDQRAIGGDIPLTPIQHWFFKNDIEDRNYFNQTVLLQLSKTLELAHLNQVFSLLLSHHDMLRVRYHQEIQGNWIQTSLAEVEPFFVQETDLSYIVLEEHLTQSIKEHSSLIQQTLNIETGPLIRVVLFKCGSNRSDRLLIVIHHLVIDGVSWRILLEDLEALCFQISQGESPSLSSKTHSYQQWARSLKDYASSQSLKEEIPYWQKILELTHPLPVDFNDGAATGESSCTIVLSLTEEETTLLLKRAPQAYRTEINDILLTALVLAVGDWTGTYSLTLSLEGHGREEVIKDFDLSRTIGWFTSLFPVYLSIDDPTDLAEALKTVKEDLRKIPHKGIGYGVLSYLTQGLYLSTFFHPSLRFNYLGQWDNAFEQEGLFTFSQESAGRNVSDKNARSYHLDINGEVKKGLFRFFWTYSSHHYHKQTIEKVSHAFMERLKQLIRHCCQKSTSGYTPSDFKLANLDQINLIDQIINKK
ncbi:MAG: amino acid adenylation domain-containing protein, partial [Candidatus Paracaedibacteraceae bacterium]|nr:amino acid adenylation domain-containing protein [Candidatus Paracaedibacteraceae bacterium]